ncbi:MAG TPA: penicillin-binding protein activator [Longimicrobium sp.]|nr:penicillin-binding protein activator [Longimicrobium sp.]
MKKINLLAVALGFAAMGCGGGADPASQRSKLAERGTGDIVVGAAWPWQAHKDVLYWQGMELALDEVNAAGGVGGRKLRILRADDQESVDQGRQVASEFARNPEVVAVIGHLQSYVTVPAAAVYDLSGLVLLSATSTSPELTSKGYRRVFRTIFTDDQVGRQMAEYAVRRGYKTFAIYYSRDEYGRGLANAFEEEALSRGGDVVNRQSYDPNLTTNRLAVEQTVQGWSDRSFDAVFIAGQDRQAALLAQELRRKGIRAPILGSDALATPVFLREGGAAAEGTVIATPYHPDAPHPQARHFTQSFQSRFGTRPDVGAALGYDAVRLLAHAIGQAGSSDPEKVATALHSVRGWQSVSGPVQFDAAGNLQGIPIAHVVVRDGRFEFLGDPDAAPATAAAPAPAADPNAAAAR